MSRKANRHDNARVESFLGRTKAHLGPTSHLTYDQPDQRTNDHMDHYTNHRRQDRPNKQTPKQYATQLTA